MPRRAHDEDTPMRIESPASDSWGLPINAREKEKFKEMEKVKEHMAASTYSSFMKKISGKNNGYFSFVCLFLFNFGVGGGGGCGLASSVCPC